MASKHRGIIMPNQAANKLLLSAVPEAMKSKAIDLSHLDADNTVLTVGHLCVFNPGRNGDPIPAIITRIYPDGEMVSGADRDPETGERIMEPWSGKLPLINLKAYRPFNKADNPGMAKPKEGWPMIDELIAAKVPHLSDVVQQAKDAGYPESMARMVQSYLIVRSIESR